MKEVVGLKKTEEVAWLRDVPATIPRMALMQVDMAYDNFFRRVKVGSKEKGFPKFKSLRRSRMCFHLEIGPTVVVIENNHVRIPKLGWLRLHQPLRFEGKLVGTVCISCTAGKWYASFSVETEIGDPAENQSGVAVGLDVGIKHLAVLSDGAKFENPKAFYKLSKLLARAQRQMAKKQEGSHRWWKARLRVQRIHKRISDLRSNATHQVTAYVVKNYGAVAIEDLNVQGMVKNRHLAKSVMDANMSELHRQLSYKMGWAGGEVRRVDRFFPSSKTCSECGMINERLTLRDREWDCECGVHHDRDVNAAKNLAAKCFSQLDGRGLTVTARGGSGEVKPSCETRTAKAGRVHRHPRNFSVKSLV